MGSTAGRTDFDSSHSPLYLPVKDTSGEGRARKAKGERWFPGFLCTQVASGRQEAESWHLFTFLDCSPTETVPVLHGPDASLEAPLDPEVFLIIVIM